MHSQLNEGTGHQETHHITILVREVTQKWHCQARNEVLNRNDGARRCMRMSKLMYQAVRSEYNSRHSKGKTY